MKLDQVACFLGLFSFLLSCCSLRKIVFPYASFYMMSTSSHVIFYSSIHYESLALILSLHMKSQSDKCPLRQTFNPLGCFIPLGILLPLDIFIP